MKSPKNRKKIEDFISIGMVSTMKNVDTISNKSLVNKKLIVTLDHKNSIPSINNDSQKNLLS